MEFNKKILDYIKEDSLNRCPEESCGLVLQKNNEIYAEKCRNLADNKIDNFIVSPSDYVRLSKNSEILSVYHSHTNGDSLESFSCKDQLTSQNTKLPMIMYHTVYDTFHFLDPNSVYLKYIGRKFQFNHSDCLSLVEDFYKNEFHIILPKTNRDSNTMEKRPRLMVDNINHYGFSIIDEPDNLQYGDLILCKNLKGPTHLMIYIGSDQILHHRYNQYSTIEQYNNFYRNQTHCVIRHKNLWN